MLIPFYVSYIPVIYLFSQQDVDFFLVLFKMSLKNKVDITTNCQLMLCEHTDNPRNSLVNLTTDINALTSLYLVAFEKCSIITFRRNLGWLAWGCRLIHL